MVRLGVDRRGSVRDTNLNVLTTLKETSQGPTNRKGMLDACIMSWLGSAGWGHCQP